MYDEKKLHIIEKSLIEAIKSSGGNKNSVTYDLNESIYFGFCINLL